MKDLLIFLAKSLVDTPDEIQVVEKETDNGILFELHVAPSDMGKVIGKQGKNAQAIRCLMKAASSKENKKVSVDIVQ